MSCTKKKNYLSVQLSSCLSKSRKKRVARFILIAFLLFILVTGIFLRYAYQMYVEKKKMTILHDYEGYLEQLSASLAALEQTGQSLDSELKEMQANHALRASNGTYSSKPH